ncbi:hypothetical protein [Micromonospora sicca]|uniref:hypothetical protein n=1 Tax=Micromonospora sicca TaxID=2202420 RepID=UPI002ACBF45F|nr:MULTISPECIES: hypothetical protein [unclassified Micromonospora]
MLYWYVDDPAQVEELAAIVRRAAPTAARRAPTVGVVPSAPGDAVAGARAPGQVGTTAGT